MKAKLLAALKTEYKTLGLSDKAFDGVASVLAKTVTKEDEIDGVVKADETKALIKAYQADADKLRQEKAQLQSEYDAYKREHPETTPPTEPPTEDEDTKKLLERIEALEQENKEAKSKAARSEKISAIRSKMKENGSDNDNILDLVLDKAEFKDGEKVEDIATRLKSEYDTTFTKFYGDGPRPHHHGNSTPEYKGTEDDDFVDKLRSEGQLPAKQN